jgi:hypothetical protein
VQWWADEPEGWQAADSVTPMDDRASGDGGYAGTTTFAARVLSFGAGETCVVAAPDRRTALRAAARLRQVIQSRDPVLYTQPGPEGDESLWLRASGGVKLRFLDDRIFEWAAVMVAEDPFKFDAAQLDSSLSVGLPLATGGYLYPVIGNKIYGVGSGSTGVLIVTNTGDEASQAIYTLVGPLDTPTVWNTTTGAWFTLDRVIAPTETAVLDTRTGTVELNGVSIYADLLGGFPLIVPGANELRWSHGGPYTAQTALVEVRRNRVPNPHAVAATSWTANYGTGGAGALTAVATGGPDGGPFARATWTTASTAVGTGQVRHDGRAAQPLPIPVTPGQVISAAVYARSSIAQRMLAQLTYFDAAGAQTGIVPTGHGGTPAVLVANTWTRLTVEGVTVPAGAAYALVGPQAVTGTGAVVWPIGATLEATMAQIETAATVGAYFDGSSTGGNPAVPGSTSYAWVGTANASASVQNRTDLTGPGSTLAVATTSTRK